MGERDETGGTVLEQEQRHKNIGLHLWIYCLFNVVGCEIEFPTKLEML
jgi:hypothetical protein